MKFCLAFLMQNDAHWLKLHLPIMLASDVFDGMVALDGGSADDSIATIRSLGGMVYEHPFQHDWGAQGNRLIAHCEALGYDALYRTDPDEVVFGGDLLTVRMHLAQDKADLLALSRYNFVGDRKHRHADWYPDPQQRAWVLHKGIHYPEHLRVHEVPTGNNIRSEHLAQCNIYHYGYAEPASTRAYKLHLYDAMQQGKPFPDRATFVHHPPLVIPNQPFIGEQPLPPEEIGLNAPFESDPPSFRLSADATGDRTLEYGWTLLNIPAAFGTKNALDFGSGGVAQLSQRALDHGWQVTALDFEATGAPAGVQMVTGDILSPDLELPPVDMILNCSSIEHVGLAGRYGVTEHEADGDLKAMRKLRDALTPGGLMLLTIPVGRDHVHRPMHRAYGEERLPKLLDGFEVLSETYWKKQPDNSWVVCSRADALSTYTVAVTKHDWQGVMFNLGAFALRKRA